MTFSPTLLTLRRAAQLKVGDTLLHLKTGTPWVVAGPPEIGIVGGFTRISVPLVVEQKDANSPRPWITELTEFSLDEYMIVKVVPQWRNFHIDEDGHITEKKEGK